MSAATSDLPAGMTDWIAATGGGEITRLERHVARREAWVVDVTRPDGSVLEGFLRLERDDVPVTAASSLRKETKIIEALGAHGIPVPAVHGRNDELRCTLFERAPGRSDIDHLTDPRQQRAVMEDFVRVMARMHTLDVDELGLAGYLAHVPANAREAALNDVDLTLELFAGFLDSYREPLITYAVDWLRRNAPASMPRLSLVQGDTGPVNFMFEGDRVTALVDFEWGHYGDPLEDLGNVCVREFWNPSGGLEGLFRLYEAESGIPYSRTGAQYYRVQQNVRGMIPIHAVTAHAHPTEPVAWFLAYRYVGDRATCEAIAEAAGIEVARPAMPDDSSTGDVLARAAAHSLANDVVPKLTDPFAASRANDVRILLEVIERRHRFGPELAEIERAELGELLGTVPDTLDAGLAALDEAIAAGGLDDAATIAYLTRRAYRDEWLHAPAVALYPDRRWSPLDP